METLFFADSRVVFHSQNCAHCFNEIFVTEAHRRRIIFAKLDQKGELNLTETETTFLRVRFYFYIFVTSTDVKMIATQREIW